MDESSLFCQRCAAQLVPGRGQFYVVRIEAFADPTPPTFMAEDLGHDIKGEIDRLIEAMSDVSAQEAMDQVYRRMTVFLCNVCYRQWIEDPVAG